MRKNKHFEYKCIKNMFCTPLVNMFTSSPDPLNTCRLWGIWSYCTQHIDLILFCLSKQTSLWIYNRFYLFYSGAPQTPVMGIFPTGNPTREKPTWISQSTPVIHIYISSQDNQLFFQSDIACKLVHSFAYFVPPRL